MQPRTMNEIHSPGKQQNGLEEIRVRPYRITDAEKIRSLFTASLVDEYHSPYSRAMQAQLVAPISWATYATIGIGLLLRFCSSRERMRRAGVLLSVTGSLIFTLYRLLFRHGLQKVVRQQLDGDLADIAKHYGLEISFGNGQNTARSGFWVAERFAKGLKPEVIGYVGFDDSTNPDPKVAELRRMIVSAKYRRRGIALQLIRALIQHARKNGVERIFLSTSSYQIEAMKMYDYYGWVPQGREDVSFLFQSIYMHSFSLQVEGWNL
ncbi:acyl-CoA N-acyltransferase [Agrocybe pediades]|nr:acyl-CoA N-acyltransferase [Agrocybe pediades]